MDTEKHWNPLQDGIEWIDPDTGDIRKARVHSYGPSKAPKEPYIMALLDTLNELAQNRELQGTDLRVLLIMLGHTVYGGRIAITAKNVGAELNLAMPTVYKSIRKLRDAELIVKNETDGLWYVHPRVAKRGDEEPRRRKPTRRDFKNARKRDAETA
ncbi:MAG: RepL [Microviridae sp.]|nr:MAG: RepL [Microviridae sp.]